MQVAGSIKLDLSYQFPRRRAELVRSRSVLVEGTTITFFIFLMMILEYFFYLRRQPFCHLVVSHTCKCPTSIYHVLLS